MKSFKEHLEKPLVRSKLAYSYDIPVDLLESKSMGETTQNASITELFPCLAFNKKFRPNSYVKKYNPSFGKNRFNFRY